MSLEVAFHTAALIGLAWDGPGNLTLHFICFSLTIYF